MADSEPTAMQRKFLRALLSPDVQLDVAAALEQTGTRLERYHQWLAEDRFLDFQREALRRFRLSLEPKLHAAIQRALDKPERWAVDLLIQMNGLGEPDARQQDDLRAGELDELSGTQQLIQRIRRLAELADTRFGQGAAGRAGGNGDGAAGEAVSSPLAGAPM